MFVKVEPGYHMRVLELLGSPGGHTEGRVINPFFTLGLPVECIPEQLQEEYRLYLAIQRHRQKLNAPSYPLPDGK